MFLNRFILLIRLRQFRARDSIDGKVSHSGGATISFKTLNGFPYHDFFMLHWIMYRIFFSTLAKTTSSFSSISLTYWRWIQLIFDGGFLFYLFQSEVRYSSTRLNVINCKSWFDTHKQYAAFNYPFDFRVFTLNASALLKNKTSTSCIQRIKPFQRVIATLTLALDIISVMASLLFN